MKILHTSDWHIGKNLESYSRLEEQEEFLKEICELCEKENVDAILLAGDIFDTFNPSSKALELFYKYSKKLSREGGCPLIAIAGNHDSPERIEAPEPLARECGIILLGYPDSSIEPFVLESGLSLKRSSAGFLELKLPEYKYPLRIFSTPYANEERLRKFLGVSNKEDELRKFMEQKWKENVDAHADEEGVNILMAHLFLVKKGKVLEETESEKPIISVGGAHNLYTKNLPSSKIQYVALGHLHKYQNVITKPYPVVYSGSPLAYSLSEAGQKKYVVIVELEPAKKAKLQKRAIHSGHEIRRETFQSVDEAVLFLQRHPEVYVELKIISETYLSGESLQRLYGSHQKIVAIIPELLQEEKEVIEEVNIQKDIKELFKDYYKFKKGNSPSDELLVLFNEILAGKEE